MTVMALKKNNMERKSKGTTVFKMKGHTLPGIKQRKSTKMADGRSKSSTFQDKEEFPGLLPTVEVSGGKGGNKKKYNAYEESIQKEVDMQLKNDITTRNLSDSDARKKVEKEVRARRENPTLEADRKKARKASVEKIRKRNEAVNNNKK